MTKTKFEYTTGGRDRDLYSGLIRLHVLHHAAEEPIFGLGMVEELARHGYRISPGTLYPLLHGLEKKGYLRSAVKVSGKVSSSAFNVGSMPGRESVGSVIGIPYAHTYGCRAALNAASP